MSDDEAWEKHLDALEANGYKRKASMWERLFWDAGRASRDAEVADAKKLQEHAVIAWRLERARAEAAEAVIATARNVLANLPGDGIPLKVGYELRDILAAVPQTVLAERDRKNRREGWERGGADHMAWMNAMTDVGPDYPLPVNPYTEKEQGNGNN